MRIHAFCMLIAMSAAMAAVSAVTPSPEVKALLDDLEPESSSSAAPSISIGKKPVAEAQPSAPALKPAAVVPVKSVATESVPAVSAAKPVPATVVVPLPQAKPAIVPAAPVVPPQPVTAVKPATNVADVTVAKPAKKLSGRESIITSERADYDRKDGVLLFDRHVHVDDEQYQMHADRVYVFLSGTNDVKRIVALGHVAITNEDKVATCAKATYTKSSSKVVMYGDDGQLARLHEESKKGGTVLGTKITFWLDSEQVEVEGSSMSLPGAALKGADAKSFLKK